MKKAFFILVVLISFYFVATAHAAVLLVQSSTAQENAVSNNVTTTLPSATTNGNLLVLLESFYDSSNSSGTVTVSDTCGNTWNSVPNDGNIKTSGNGFIYIYYAWNITGCSSEKINSKSSLATPFITIAAAEFSGVQNSSNPLDQSSLATGATAPASSGNVTTAQQDLFVGDETDDNNSTVTAGTNFTRATTILTGQGLTTEWASFPATTSAATFNLSPNAIWAVGLATFKATSPATIVFDNAQIATTTASTTAGIANFSVTSTPNRIVLMAVTYGTGTNAKNVTTTFGGVNGTLVASSTGGSLSSNGESTSLWYFLNPPSGNSNATATFSATTRVTAFSVLSYAGVNQTTPIGATTTKAEGATSSSISASLTTLADNSFIVNALGLSTTTTIGAPTPGAGQNARTSAGAINTSNYYQGSTDDYSAGAAGAYPMSETYAATTNFSSYVLAELEAAGGAPAHPSTPYSYVLAYGW